MGKTYEVFGIDWWDPFEIAADETRTSSISADEVRDASRAGRSTPAGVPIEWRPHLGPDQADEGLAGTTLRQSPEQHESRPILAALSWLMNLAIEGFAAYAASMHPCFLHPGDHIDSAATDQNSQHLLAIQSGHMVPWQLCAHLSLAEATGRPEKLTPSRMGRARLLSRIASFWQPPHRERNRLTVEK